MHHAGHLQGRSHFESTLARKAKFTRLRKRLQMLQAKIVGFTPQEPLLPCAKCIDAHKHDCALVAWTLKLR